MTGKITKKKIKVFFGQIEVSQGQITLGNPEIGGPMIVGEQAFQGDLSEDIESFVIVSLLEKVQPLSHFCFNPGGSSVNTGSPSVVLLGRHRQAEGQQEKEEQSSTLFHQLSLLKLPTGRENLSEKLWIRARLHLLIIGAEVI